jgi:hypothetical protein
VRNRAGYFVNTEFDTARVDLSIVSVAQPQVDARRLPARHSTLVTKS